MNGFCRDIQRAVDINEQPLADAPKPEVEGGKLPSGGSRQYRQYQIGVCLRDEEG